MNLFHLLLLLAAANAWTEVEFRGTIFCPRLDFEYKLYLKEVDMISDQTLYEDPEYIVVRNGSQEYRAFGGCEDDGPEDKMFEFAMEIEHNCNLKREFEFLVIGYNEVPLKTSKVYFRGDYHLDQGDAATENKTSMTTVDKDTNRLTCHIV